MVGEPARHALVGARVEALVALVVLVAATLAHEREPLDARAAMLHDGAHDLGLEADDRLVGRLRLRRGDYAVVGKDKEKLIRIVLKGMKGVDIDDEPYNNVMAPHPELTDQQIADVLTYVRNSWTNKASAVSPAEVKVVRAKIK